MRQSQYGSIHSNEPQPLWIVAANSLGKCSSKGPHRLLKTSSRPLIFALSVSIGRSLKLSRYHWVIVGDLSLIQLNKTQFCGNRSSFFINWDLYLSCILFRGGSPKRNCPRSLQFFHFKMELTSLVMCCQKFDIYGQLHKQCIYVLVHELHLRFIGELCGANLFKRCGILCCLCKILYCISLYLLHTINEWIDCILSSRNHHNVSVFRLPIAEYVF